MNVRFVVRGLLLALPLACLLTGGWILLQSPWGRAPDPTPPPPTILAPTGALPDSPAGLQAWARYRDEDYQLVASGFFLELPGGQVVGVTAAHSMEFDHSDHPLERIALGVPGAPALSGEFDTAWGPPGRLFSADDLTTDYVLLVVPERPEPGLVLTPDPRGGPQPGERVILASGLGDGRGARRWLAGTVQTAGEQAFWVLMDDLFAGGRMSGSPLLSQHTGQVVGMVLAGSPRRGHTLIGAHPVGSLLELALAADSFPLLSEAQPAAP